MSHLARVDLPDFGRDAVRPEIPARIHLQRLAAAAARTDRSGLDALVIYADREHCANLAYLTGFDPRFEEALLLLRADGSAQLLVGNECMGYLPDEALGLAVERFQDFSLPGQPRSQSRPLREILRAFDITTGARVGCAGWKPLDARLAGAASSATASAMEIPAYIVDALRELSGSSERIVNANAIFVNPADGLRLRNEPEQIAAFEYASTRTSDGVRRLLQRLAPGARECDLEAELRADGLPLSCHRMIGFGDKVRRGLASPSDRPAQLGDPFTTAFGVVGALTCRAGCVAHGADDLPRATRDFYDAFARNYFDVIATWYRSLRIGVTGGEVFAAVDARRDPALFEFALNPGHFLHLDEWLHSPFAAGSNVQLASGAALQADIIPVSAGPFCYSNAEDGIVLADGTLRAVLAQDFPACWQRIEARRAFMRDTLAIELDGSVLPLSNIPAWLAPFALDLDHALVA